MRTFLALSIILFSVSQSFAQSDSPPVAWKSVTWQVNRPDGTLELEQDDSGEDWWYSITKMYDEAENHTGYIAVGYSNFDDIIYSETGDCFVGAYDTTCPDFHAGTDPQGTSYQSIGIFNLAGKMIACRSVYPGVFFDAFQTKDRSSIVAVGNANANKDRLSSEWNGPANGFLAINPMIDGSGDTIWNTFSPCNSLSTTPKAGQRPSIVKMDMNLDVSWSYLYTPLNIEENEDSASSQDYIDEVEPIYEFMYGEFYGAAELSDSSIAVVGRSNHIEDNTLVTEHDDMFVVNIDSNGMLNWKDSPLDTDSKTSKALCVVEKPGSGAFYVGGTVHSGFNTPGTAKMKLLSYTMSTGNLSMNKSYSTADEAYLDDSKYSGIYSLDVDNSGAMILGGVVNGFDPLQSHNATCYGLVLTVNPSTGALVNNALQIGQIKAYDIKLDASVLSNGDLAVTSSKLNTTSGIPWTYSSFTSAFPSITIPHYGDPCSSGDYFFMNYDVDAYVGRYEKNGSGQWDSIWGQRIDSDDDRSNFPGQIKKQECLYKIVESEDGELIVAGNSSHNHDDNYIITLYEPCEIDDSEFHLPTYYSPSDWTYNSGTGTYSLTSNLSWTNATLHLKGSMWIPTGKKLTVDNCTIYFADSKRMGEETKLYVLGGGEIELKNTTVLSANDDCNNSMWDGITVIGNPNSTNTSHQGKITINDSKIEHARWAVTLGNPTNTALAGWQGGGIIESQGSTFENNHRDIIMYPHPASKPGASSLSYIRDSYFKTTSTMRDPRYTLPRSTDRGGAHIHVTLWDVHGVEISGDTFLGSTSIDEAAWSTGIYSIDATYKVGCRFQNSSGCTSDANSFSNLQYGINAVNYSDLSAPEIVANNFENISRTGIYLKSVNHATIVDNTFEQNWGYAATWNGTFYEDYACAQCSDTARAIYLYDCNGYTVEDNEMVGGEPELGVRQGIGIEIYNTNAGVQSTWENEIYRNNFEKLAFASFGNKQNRGQELLDKGLDIRCGEYTSNAFDILTTISPGISSEQGSPQSNQTLAGNVFDGCLTDEGELLNDGWAYTYHCHDTSGSSASTIPSPSCYTPDSVMVAVKINVDFNDSSCKANAHYEGRASVVKSQYASAHSDYQAELTNYDGLIDNGNTNQLLSIISNDDADNVVKSLYDAASPYVSDEGLLALIDDKPSPMNETDLVSILEDNSPLTEVVYNAADKRTPAISSGGMATIDNAQHGVSARSHLEDTLAWARRGFSLAKDRYISSLIQTYDDDHRLDTLIDVLDDDSDTVRQLQLAQAQIMAGYTSAAGGILSAIESSSNWGDYAKLLQEVKNWAIDSVGVDSILHDSTLLSTVEGWSADESSSGYTRSRGILEFLYEMNHDTRQGGDHLIPEVTVFPEWDQTADKRNVSEEVEPDDLGSKEDYSLKAYPNPFNSSIRFELPPVVGQLSIYSISGNLIDQIHCSDPERTFVEYNAPELGQGIYFVTFSSKQLNYQLNARIVKL